MEEGRELERIYGLDADNSREKESDLHKITEKTTLFEAQIGEQSFQGYAKEQEKPLLKDVKLTIDKEGTHE